MFGALNGFMTATAPAAPSSPVSYDSSATNYLNSAGTPRSTTATLTVASNTNRILIAIVTISNGGPFTTNAVSATSNNGGAMTLLTGSVSYTPSNLGNTRIFYMINPPTGSHTVTFTYNDPSWLDGIKGAVLSYYNVSQSAPFGTPVIGNGNGTTPTNTVSSTSTNSRVLWAFGTNTTQTFTQTARTSTGATDAGYADFLKTQDAAGTGSSITCVGNSGTVYNSVGVEIIPA